MTNIDKKKLLTRNAAIWAGGILASVVLPFVTDSLSDGPGAFLRLMAHVFPLLAAIWISNSAISSAIGDAAD